MKEAIVVEARFETDGSLRPISFEWKGDLYIIESHGRNWEADGIQYFLVMTAGEQVFELAYLNEENQWVLSRHPVEFKPPSML